MAFNISEHIDLDVTHDIQVSMSSLILKGNIEKLQGNLPDNLKIFEYNEYTRILTINNITNYIDLHTYGKIFTSLYPIINDIQNEVSSVDIHDAINCTSSYKCHIFTFTTNNNLENLHEVLKVFYILCNKLRELKVSPLFIISESIDKKFNYKTVREHIIAAFKGANVTDFKHPVYMHADICNKIYKKIGLATSISPYIPFKVLISKIFLNH